MNDKIQVAPSQAAIIEQLVIGGDLSKLSAEQRVVYYRQVCESLGLNPYTKPFSYLNLNGKLVLYANKDATDQLRNNRTISITKLERERLEEIYLVTAYAAMPDGRQDSSIGAVNIANLKGDALANAMMKAETKAKRRVTLSISGLGMLDETELETIPNVTVTPIPDTTEPTKGNGKAQTEPEQSAMTLEEAWAMVGQDKRPYKELTLPEIAIRLGSMEKYGRTHDLDPEKAEDYRQRKQALILCQEHLLAQSQPTLAA